MNKTVHPLQLLYIFGIPLIIIFSMIILAKSSIYIAHPKQLTIGITLDLVFTVPLFYFLSIKNKTIPNTTVVPVFVLGIFITTLILPKDQQFLVTQIKYWILPLVELFILILTIYKVRQARTLFKQQASKENSDFFSVMKNTTSSLFPQKVSILISTEIAVIYYGFINWKKRRIHQNEFTYHKHSSVIALLSVFTFLIIGETAIIHYLLQKWSVIAAWILTFLSIYTAIQLFGIIRSMRKRPISIGENQLTLKHGIFSETTIPFNEIESIEQTSRAIEFNKNIIRLSPLGELTSYNFIIHVKSDQTLVSLYGFKKRYKTIAFHVDNVKAFESKLKSTLEENTIQL